MRCTIGLSMTIPLRISKITKSKGPDLDRNFMNMFRTCEKLPKDSGENFSVHDLYKMWYLWSKNMKGMIDKVEILHRDQSDPTLQKTSDQLFFSRPRHCANISPQHSTHNIQLVPNI